MNLIFSTHHLLKMFSVFFSITVFLFHSSYAAESNLDVKVVWRYHAHGGACEIPSFDPSTNQLFVTGESSVYVIESSSGKLLNKLNIQKGYKPTSVACHQGKVAVAWAAENKRERGKVLIYDAKKADEIASFSAGYLPDMVTFTPDGNFLLAANEGEPTDDYSFDPDGSVTIIDISRGMSSAAIHEALFVDFNPRYNELLELGIRLYGSNKTSSNPAVAQDLEPEYIAVSSDSSRAWITLQENNAVAELNIQAKEIVALHPLGKKDYSQLSSSSSGNTTTGFDASDQDGGAKIRHWPVFGLYQPDGITTFEHADETYLITANEGDPRDYIGFCESVATQELALQGIRFDEEFRGRFLSAPSYLGRLKVSAVSGDIDKDGDLDELHCFGTRSFSIWRVEKSRSLKLVYDSGSDFESITAIEAPDRYNADSIIESQPDVRSRSRGPEPESVVVGRVGTNRLAMIGLERTGGFMIYDVSTPESTRFMKYVQPYYEDKVLDCSPEGLLFIPKENSPLKLPMLIVCNEASGTTTAYVLQWNDE